MSSRRPRAALPPPNTFVRMFCAAFMFLVIAGMASLFTLCMEEFQQPSSMKALAVVGMLWSGWCIAASAWFLLTSERACANAATCAKAASRQRKEKESRERVALKEETKLRRNMQFQGGTHDE